MTTTTPAAGPMTAAEFVVRHGHESGVELVRGYVRRMPMPGGRHGEVCVNATLVIGEFVKSRGLGRVMSNDTFVRTTTDPDTYRGADVLFLSHRRWPADRPVPDGPLEVPPELVVEVKSPSDRRGEIRTKVGEYESVGVDVVVVLDPDLAVATVYRGEELPQRFHNGDEFTLPDVLPGFAVPVARFFE
jgi:Uma2 family endonuclease